MSRLTNTSYVNATSRSRWTAILPWFFVLLLTLSNLGTLISGRVHSVGFKAIESVLSVWRPSVRQRVLARSVTRTAERQARLVRTVATRSTGRLVTHATRSIAAIPERVIPGLGSAAVVGFTIYDVQTDCATAKDMNEILAGLDQEQIDTGAICRLMDRVPSPSRAWALSREIANRAQQKATPLEFARAIFEKLDLYTPAVLDAWYQLFATRRPEYFPALLRAA